MSMFETCYFPTKPRNCLEICYIFIDKVFVWVGFGPRKVVNPVMKEYFNYIYQGLG